MRTLTLEKGSEWAPDARWGSDALSVGSDGRVQYVNRDHGRAREARGTIRQERAVELFAALDTSTFPAISAHRIPPGASLVKLSVAEGQDVQSVIFDLYFAEDLPGYGMLVEICAVLATALRTGDSATLEAWGFEPALEPLAVRHD